MQGIGVSCCCCCCTPHPILAIHRLPVQQKALPSILHGERQSGQQLDTPQQRGLHPCKLGCAPCACPPGAVTGSSTLRHVGRHIRPCAPLHAASMCLAASPGRPLLAVNGQSCRHVRRDRGQAHLHELRARVWRPPLWRIISARVAPPAPVRAQVDILLVRGRRSSAIPRVPPPSLLPAAALLTKG